MRRLIRFLITFLVTIPFFVYLLSLEDNRQSFIGSVENYAYDLRVQQTMQKVPEQNVVILDIDEKSLAEIGQWPWRRDLLAELVDALFDDYQINVLAFDMAFPEKDRALDIELLDQLENELNKVDLAESVNFSQIREERDRDRIFAESLRNRKVVLGFILDGATDVAASGELPDAMMPASFLPKEYKAYEYATYIGNLPVLQNAAVNGGNFNPTSIDVDGKIRSIPMLLQYQDYIYESLSLATARLALDVDTIEFNYENPEEELSFTGIKLGTHHLAMGDSYEMLIPYQGGLGTFDYISVADVLAQRVSKESLLDKVVILGTTAAGLKDLRVTPVGENFPGVEVNANMVSAIMNNLTRAEPEYSYVLQMLSILLIGIVVTLVMSYFSILASSLLTLFIGIGAWVMNLMLWNNGFVIPIAPFLLFLGMLYVAHMFYGSFIESRNKNKIKKLFGQYVPPSLVEEMDAGSEQYTMETRDSELTVLFADIESFTKISEELSPEEVTRMLGEFLNSMTEIIHEHRGTIDKYMGDAIMAFWGAPISDEQHANHAVTAALKMHEAIPVMNQRLKKMGLPELKICIGINTGEMRVGNMGSEFRMAYTVIGDEVNLASRIESLTRVYGANIIVSENTRLKADQFSYLDLDIVLVKGKDNSVRIYEPISILEETSDSNFALIQRTQQAQSYYRERDWLKAKEAFQGLVTDYPEKPLFLMLLNRINTYLDKPPSIDWQGTHRFEVK